ncbi:hypothetical protein D3C85_1398290 [compost metagenome]
MQNDAGITIAGLVQVILLVDRVVPLYGAVEGAAVLAGGDEHGQGHAGRYEVDRQEPLGDRAQRSHRFLGVGRQWPQVQAWQTGAATDLAEALIVAAKKDFLRVHV